jgi:hypothetical protein
VTVRDRPALVAVVVTFFGCWLMKEAESLKAHLGDSLITAMSGRWLSCRSASLSVASNQGSASPAGWRPSDNGLGQLDERDRHEDEDDRSARGVGRRARGDGVSHGYGPGVGEDEAIDLMRSAFDLGCTFYDTAESYAAGANERLVSRALAPIRDKS